MAEDQVVDTFMSENGWMGGCGVVKVGVLMMCDISGGDWKLANENRQIQYTSLHR
jgi:hypothetical protein